MFPISTLCMLLLSAARPCTVGVSLQQHCIIIILHQVMSEYAKAAQRTWHFVETESMIHHTTCLSEDTCRVYHYWRPKLSPFTWAQEVKSYPITIFILCECIALITICNLAHRSTALAQLWQQHNDSNTIHCFSLYY